MSWLVDVTTMLFNIFIKRCNVSTWSWACKWPINFSPCSGPERWSTAEYGGLSPLCPQLRMQRRFGLQILERPIHFTAFQEFRPHPPQTLTGFTQPWKAKATGKFCSHRAINPNWLWRLLWITPELPTRQHRARKLALLLKQRHRNLHWFLLLHFLWGTLWFYWGLVCSW